MAGSPEPGQGHGLETSFNQIAFKKQKGKSSLTNLTFGHLEDEGTKSMIYCSEKRK